MGGGDADAVRRVERARREFNRLNIQQPQARTTQQSNPSFVDPQAMLQQVNPFFMDPQAMPQLGRFNSLVFQPQPMTQEASLFVRRVYVGGLPPFANEQTVAVFFNQVMAAIGGTACPGDAVCSVSMNHEQRSALVEFRAAEEASNAMALDGILFEGLRLKVRRPADYNPSRASSMGPSQPSPKLNLAAVGLTEGSNGGGLEGPDRIFVGGLPCYFTEAQVRKLLESFGPLRGFDLVKDRETGDSKGYAFCVYMDTKVTDIACAALNGIKMGDKTLTVRRANQGPSQPRQEQESILLTAQQLLQMQFNRLHIQPEVPTTQQFNRSFVDPEATPQQVNPFFMDPHVMPQLARFNSLVFQPQDTIQLMTQEASLFVRRVYVGGLPPFANEQTVAVFFNEVMAAIGGTGCPGDAVCSVSMNHEQRSALVEFRLAEEASNAMALDGILFEGARLKIRRPADYNPSQAAAMGPSQPSPKLNLAAVGITEGSDGGGLEDPDRIFVGGLPYSFTEAQVRELLESFGPLRGFDLVKERETDDSKGYAFCVYMDNTVTDIACAALNGIKMGDKTLTVRRVNHGTSQLRPEQESILLQAQQQVQMQKLASPVGAASTKVVCLVHAVNADELKDDEEYEDIIDDMRQEARRYGNLVKVMIPRPDPSGHHLVTGIGKVFLEFADVYSATRAKMALHGRKFDGKPVVASYYPEHKFANMDLNA